MSEESTAGGWKVRYETALQEMSAESRAASKLEARLRSAISRLAVLGLGGDRELDRRLDNLRRAIHAEASADEVLRLVDAISARVRLLSENEPAPQTVEGDDAYRRFLVNLLILLRRTDPDDARISGLMGRVRAVDSKDLPALSMAVENLLTQKLSGNDTAKGGSGFLEKLLSRGGSNDADGAIQPFQLLLDRLQQRWPQDSPGQFEQHLQALAKRLRREGSNALIPVAADLAELIEQESQTVAGPVADQQASEPSARPLLDGSKPLIQVVSALRVPDEFADTADALTRQADQAIADPKRLSSWLSELAGMIRHFRNQLEQERKGMRRFLEKTLSRLAELDGHFDAEDEDRRMAAEKAHGVDQRLDGAMSQLRQFLRAEDDTPALQQKITQHLEALDKSLKLKRKLEDDRERAMERRLREMRHRVNELEEESDQLRDSLRRQSRRDVLDPLTRLPNRRAWEERVGYERARQQRRDRPLSLLTCALEDIALINDRLGPEAGDVAIADFAEKLSAAIRPGDFVARLDGVEFVLLLPDSGADVALEMAGKLSEHLSGGDFVYEDIPFSLSGVFGVAEFHESETPEKVLRRARDAMRDASADDENYRLAPPPPPSQPSEHQGRA